MANGLAPYLLDHIKQVTGDGANPMYKVVPNGLTSMLMTAGNPNNVRIDQKNGHKREFRVKYRPRFTKAQTDTSKACDQTIVPSWSEATVSLASTRQFAFHITDETIAQYMEDASRTVAFGKPATSLMNAEIMDTIFSAANALLDGVESDLISALTWGKNRVSGSNAAVTLNFNDDATVQLLTEGMSKLLSDYKKNFLTGRPQVVGSGLFLNYIVTQFAKSYDISGINSAIMAGAIDFWHSEEFATLVGSNDIGVFEPGSIQLVEYLEYQGFKGGQKPGASTFGTLPLPMVVKNEVVPVEFDFQLRYNDCQTTMQDEYSGSTLTLEKGYNLILSKQFGLFQLPADAYRHEDMARSVNGALRYTVTNG